MAMPVERSSRLLSHGGSFIKRFPPYFPQDLHPPFLAGFFAALTGFAAFAALVAFFVTLATFAATFFVLMVPILGSSFV